jgi:hypothetical protein
VRLGQGREVREVDILDKIQSNRLRRFHLLFEMIERVLGLGEREVREGGREAREGGEEGISSLTFIGLLAEEPRRSLIAQKMDDRRRCRDV